MIDRALLIEELFNTAAELPAAERARFLDTRCAGDNRLRREVEGLLANDEEMPEGYLDSPIRPDGRPAGTSLGDTVSGRYRLIREIGEGGMGVVYLAEQIKPVRRRVAVKVLKAGLDTRQVIARFDAERQTLAMMDHPNVARVLDAGATDAGRPYFVMELIEGQALTEYCSRHALGVRARLELFLGVCEAVQHAHTKGVIHRDLKPGNIIVTTRDGGPSPRVIDFGIAKAIETPLGAPLTMTQRGQFVGTPEYMSPEQAVGDPDIDTRTDVYSLGAVLYELLTGARPFEASDVRPGGVAELERFIREVEPPKPSTRARTLETRAGEPVEATQGGQGVRSRSLRGDLDWIVMRALEKDRTRRYETVAALAADLRRHLQSEPVEAGPPSTLYRTAKFVRRNRAFVGSASVVGLVLVGATVLTGWLAVRESAASRRAHEHATKAEAASERAESVKDFLEQMLTTARSMHEVSANVTLLDVLGVTTERLETGALRAQPDVEAEVRWIIGRSYLEQGWMPQALPHFAWVVDYRERELGGSDPETLDAMWAYGEALKETSNYHLALPVFERFFDRAIVTLGPDDRRTWIALDQIGNTLMRLRRSDEALPMHQRAYAELTRMYGEDDARTVLPLFNTGGCLRVLGRYEEAVPIYERVIRMFDAGDSQGHYVSGVRARVELGNILAHGLGRRDEGESLLNEALDRATARLGPEHGETAGVHLHLARFAWRAGRTEQAEREMGVYASFLDRVYGREMAQVLSRQIEQGCILMARGEAAEALHLFSDSAERIASSGDSVLDAEYWPGVSRREGWVAIAQCCEALALLELGHAQRAETLAAKALEVIGAKFPERSGHRSEALRLIASARISQNRLREAGEALEAALDEAERGDSAEARARVLITMARLSAAEGDRAGADRTLASIGPDRWTEAGEVGEMWFPRVERVPGEMQAIFTGEKP